MGDFAFHDLTRPDGMYPQHVAALCAGCGGSFIHEDRCYADFDHIWHSQCWPKVLNNASPETGPTRPPAQEVPSE